MERVVLNALKKRLCRQIFAPSAMASSSEKPIHLAQTNNIHICQREFSSHLARSRMPKRRGEFQMSLSQESSLLAQTFCRTSNQFTLGKARSRQLMRRSFFSSCGKIGNQRFRTSCDRFIRTISRRSFSFQSQAAFRSTCTGLRRIALDKLGIEARATITNLLSERVHFGASDATIFSKHGSPRSGSHQGCSFNSP